MLDTPIATGTTLLSYKTTTAPSIDGTVDGVWDNATKLNVTPQVPDAGNGLFAGYIGQTYPATVRSMYDDKNIYFLVEWADATHNAVQPWYFNPTTSRWAQRVFSYEHSSIKLVKKKTQINVSGQSVFHSVFVIY